ncbi:MAG: ABC transporter ATP-binding protein [Pirellulales bacterium]|nr:ABC transporter ATP-binding protein [Pirellulales bacterium]
MIRIEQLQFAVGSFALRKISLHVRPGEYFVLLGPTGSGKTLLIECLCGLNRIRSGRIHIDGVDVTRYEPRNRGIGYLPQDYALFPHRTVRQNVGFGLASRRSDPTTIRREVDRLMEQVGVGHLANRYPERLSGGEKQRVALARALAIRPQVLVLDEPVSALDEQTRDELCRQLKQLQLGTRTTTVHVCHNFAEMLSVADRVGIIQQGGILQVGAPADVLQRPAGTQVARFVQVGNLFAARARDVGGWVEVDCRQGIVLRAAKRGAADLSGQVTVMVRPENVRLTPATPEKPPEATALEGSVSAVVDLGPLVRVRVCCGEGVQWLASLGKREYQDHRLAAGDRVHLSIDPSDVHIMKDEPATGPEKEPRNSRN